MQKRWRKAIAISVTAVMLGSTCSPVNSVMATTGSENIAVNSVLNQFVNFESDTDSKPMARFWFPDAGAGLTSSDLETLQAQGEDIVQDDEYLQKVADQIESLYEAGFGGVEMTMLSDGTTYDNVVSNVAGWGSAAWTRILTQALYTANNLGEDQFKIDITIAPHWPCIIDTVDPNDDEQQQETISTVQTISVTGSSITVSGSAIQLSLPEERTKDKYTTVQFDDPDRCASFLFVSKLVGTTLAIQNADGTLDYNSLTSINSTKVLDANGYNGYAGYSAGVPGTEYIAKVDGHWIQADSNKIETLVDDTVEFTKGTVVYHDGDSYYQAQKTTYTNTFNINIPETAGDGSTYYVDENGRSFMDDWQYLYEVNTAELQAALDNLGQLGDGQSYVLVNSYRRGTGVISSGGTTTATTMNNRTYEIDYYNQKGIQTIIDYWETNMLDKEITLLDGTKTTLRQQLSISGNSCIFEDSLELTSSSGSSFWSAYFVDQDNEAGDNAGYEGDWERYLGYKVAKYLPILYGYSVVNDNGIASKISSDYSSLKEELFNKEHTKTISNWAHTLGGGYRFQSSTDLARALNTDIIEADNGTLGSMDGITTAASTVNVRGDKYLSMEAITSTTSDPDYYQTLVELNMNFSGGINRVILHGTPFLQSLMNNSNKWPGWNFADRYWGSGYGAWSSRQPLWSNIDTFTDYVTRVQGILQNAKTKIPVMFVGSGNMQSLINQGYHYNVCDESTIMLDEASPDKIINGVLSPNGLATEAIVVNGITAVSDVSFIERLTEYAKNGLKIILYNNDTISSIEGVQYGDVEGSNISALKSDSAVQAAFATLKSTQNVITDINSEDELLAYLNANTTNSVSYNQSGLQVTHLTDPTNADDYYYFYNNHSNGSISYGMVGTGLDMSNVTGLSLSTDVTLDFSTGSALYQLDAYTGKIAKLTDYKDNGNGTITYKLSMEPWDATILAVATDAQEFTAAGATENQDFVENTAATVDLTAADWDLTIDSYAPSKLNDDATAPFYQSTITSLKVGKVKLGLWGDLGVSSEDLATLGITTDKYNDLVNDFNNGGHLVKGNYIADSNNLSSYISGIGYYETSFNWDGNAAGAYFYFTHKDSSKTGDAQTNADSVMEITITNADGKVTTIKNINPLVNKVDLGSALSKGNNTIKVKLTGTLRNRELLEKSLVWRYSLSSYGLTSASVVPYSIEVTGVSLSKTTVSLTKGSATTLVATIAPSNATNKAVTWSSSDSSVATVNSNGMVSAKTVGTATITATTADGSKVATCVVTVVNSSSSGNVITVPSTTTTPTPTPKPTVTPKPTDTTKPDSSDTTKNDTASTNNASVTAKTTSIKESTNRVLSQILDDSQKGSVVTVSSKKMMKGTVEITASIADATVGQRVYIYKLNAKTKKLEVIVGGFSNKLSGDKTVTFDVLEKGTYVVLTKKAPASQVTSLAKQITVKASSSKISVDNTSSIKVNLPKCLKKVSNINTPTTSDAVGNVKVTYKTSNSKVVTVSKNGTITAKKAGTIIVTTTIQLYNGTTKTVKTKITVK